MGVFCVVGIEPNEVMRGKFGFWEAAIGTSSTASSVVAVSETEIENELRAQIDWFIASVGVRPSHIDGHNHIHVIPSVVSVMCKVMRHYQIGWTRMPKDIPPPLITNATATAAAATATATATATTAPAPLSDFLQRVVLYCPKAAELFISNGIRFSDAFIGLRTMGVACTSDQLIAQIKRSLTAHTHSHSHSSPPVIEVMVHPGYASAGGDEFSRSSDRHTELTTLTQSELRQTLTDSLKVLPVSFHFVSAPPPNT